MYDLIRYKSEAWKYEHELRLLNVTTCGFLDMPQAWLKSITVGLATENELKEKLKSIGHELNVPVFFARIHESNYQIEIPGLDIKGIDGQRKYEELVASKVLELK